ncbi:MAG: hypothetical protein JKY82_13895 [Rhizobiaceae bacterium]|nr:hypothetical protein [Rhizobiaceae bacterium]
MFQNLFGVFIAMASMLIASQASAQNAVSGELAQKRADEQEINNGTNPTLLTTISGIQYQHNQINSKLSTGTWEAFVRIPFGVEKRMAFEFTAPYASGTLDTSFGGGDIALKFVHVTNIETTWGAAYAAELFLDTAERTDIGYGETVLEFSAFYARFLEDGSIFAPAWVQLVGLEGNNPSGIDINQSTIDFYYVPKLANPNFFMTLDPALTYDWERDTGFASLQVTMGMLTGKAFGGDSQIFIKPGIYAGINRPLDFSFQIGFKVLNF